MTSKRRKKKKDPPKNTKMEKLYFYIYQKYSNKHEVGSSKIHFVMGKSTP